MSSNWAHLQSLIFENLYLGEKLISKTNINLLDKKKKFIYFPNFKNPIDIVFEKEILFIEQPITLIPFTVEIKPNQILKINDTEITVYNSIFDENQNIIKNPIGIFSLNAMCNNYKDLLNLSVDKNNICLKFIYANQTVEQISKLKIQDLKDSFDQIWIINLEPTQNLIDLFYQSFLNLYNYYLFSTKLNQYELTHRFAKWIYFEDKSSFYYGFCDELFKKGEIQDIELYPSFQSNGANYEIQNVKDQPNLETLVQCIYLVPISELNLKSVCSSIIEPSMVDIVSKTIYFEKDIYFEPILIKYRTNLEIENKNENIFEIKFGENIGSKCNVIIDPRKSKIIYYLDLTFFEIHKSFELVIRNKKSDKFIKHSETNLKGWKLNFTNPRFYNLLSCKDCKIFL